MVRFIRAGCRYAKWFVVFAVILILTAALVVGRWFDDEIRNKVQADLAEHYPNLRISVQSAALVAGEGIRVRGVRLVDPASAGLNAELAYFDEILFACQTTKMQLLSGSPQVTRVVVYRPRLRVTRAADGSFSVQKLWPLPEQDDPTPINAVIENATIELIDSAKSPPSLYTLRDVNITLKQRQALDAQSDDRVVVVSGRLRGDHLRKLTFSGEYHVVSGRWTGQASLEGLDLSPEFHAALPDLDCGPLESLRTLRARTKIKAQASFHPQDSQPWKFDVTAEVSRGRIDDPRLPYPLTDLHATVRLTERGVRVTNLVARNRQTTLQLALTRHGYHAQAPMTVQASGRRMALDRQLFESLPAEYRVMWSKYAPAGELDVDLKLVFDGQTWSPDAEARLLGASFRYYEFPLRLERATGTIGFKDNRLEVNILAYDGADKVNITGDLHNPGPLATGWMQAQADAIRIDEGLLSAVPKDSQGAVRSLRPAGSVDVLARYWRENAQSEEQTYLRLGLKNCSFRLDDFPYPVNNVRGVAEMTNNQWTFHDLHGDNDTGRFTCRGTLTTSPQRDVLDLTLSGVETPLEEELRDALEPRVQTLWNDLRPRGAVNFTSQIRYTMPDARLNVWARLEPHGETASIEPTAFPYRLEKLRGAVVYEDGHVELENLRATHGRATIAAEGQCDALPEGGWRLRLSRIEVDRLNADRDLTQALPKRMRPGVADMKIQGPVNLRGAVTFTQGPRPEDRIEADWDVDVVLHDNSLRAGSPIHGLHGVVNIAGGWRDEALLARGKIKLDSLRYKNLQLTEVRGPLFIDNEKFLLGAPTAPAVDPQRYAHLSARAYGGMVYGDCWLTRDAQGKFALRGNVREADLGRLAREEFVGRQQFSGKLSATLQLRGASGETRSLTGSGRAQLRDANFYELPLMVSLFKVLKLKNPDPTAFTTSDVRYRVEGERVYLDEVTFAGDAISLRGRGEVNFDRQVRLLFRTELGREGRRTIISELIGGASEQIMVVHVEGPLDDPKVRKEPFPGVAKLLQQLQSDLQRPRPLRRPERSGVLPRGILPPRR